MCTDCGKGSSWFGRVMKINRTDSKMAQLHLVISWNGMMQNPWCWRSLVDRLSLEDVCFVSQLQWPSSTWKNNESSNSSGHSSNSSGQSSNYSGQSSNYSGQSNSSSGLSSNSCSCQNQWLIIRETLNHGLVIICKWKLIKLFKQCQILPRETVLSAYTCTWKEQH